MIHVHSHSCQDYFGVGFLKAYYYIWKLDWHSKLGQWQLIMAGWWDKRCSKNQREGRNSNVQLMVFYLDILKSTTDFSMMLLTNIVLYLVCFKSAYFFFNFFVLFTYLPEIPLPPLSLSPQASHPYQFLRKSKASHVWHIQVRQEQAPSHCIKAD